MKYQLEITPYAHRQMKKLPELVRLKIREKLDELCVDPYSSKFDVKKLKGGNGYRLRVGDYRVIYELENKRLVIVVFDAGHRREIYQ